MKSTLQEFLKLESASGLLLMGAAALALIVANSPLGDYYALLLNVPVEVRVGVLEIAKPLLLWVNDGLMAVFFLIGLERLPVGSTGAASTAFPCCAVSVLR